MKIGTKSVLFGAHCFFLHPWFVAAAWWKLYGFPFDPRLWVAFFVHDLGYWGKPNMDGIEGERHPYFGAKIMQRLFDKKERIWHLVDPHVTIPYNEPIEIWDGLRIKTARLVQGGFEEITDGTPTGEWVSWSPIWWRTLQTTWYTFSLHHSRFLSKRNGAHFSRLCVADKYAIALTPAWLYLPMVRATGEIHEYLKLSKQRENPEHAAKIDATGQKQWYASLRRYMVEWVAEHKDLRPDTWTPDIRTAKNETGVWQ